MGSLINPTKVESSGNKKTYLCSTTAVPLIDF